jgi:hypothetical protein
MLLIGYSLKLTAWDVKHLLERKKIIPIKLHGFFSFFKNSKNGKVSISYLVYIDLKNNKSTIL